MAIFTRFECPRCQHVFVTEGDADAFADCPKCQSMALAIGEASSGSVQGLPRATASLASDDGAPARTTSGAPISERTSDGGARGGVFSQLLESTDAFEVQVDVTGDNLRVPATLDDMPAASDEERDVFNESTVAADLPPSVLLTRMMSDEDEDEVHRAPTEVLKPRHSPASDPEATIVRADVQQRTEDLGSPFSANELDSAFDLPADDEEAWENGPPPSVATKDPALLDEDAWENGPPPGLSQPEPSASLPRPPGTGEIARRASNAALDLTRQDMTTGEHSLPDEFSMELHEERADRPVGPAERRGVWDPNFNSGEMKAGAVLLSDLEAQLGGGVRLDEAASAGDLSGNELNALESAFSQMAGGSPTSRAEDALRQASLQAADSMLSMPTHSQLQGTAVPAPPSEGEPPSLSRRKRPAHLSLSEEAKALAGISIQPAAGSQNLALELTRGVPQQPAAKQPAGAGADVDEEAMRARPASHPTPSTAEQIEVTDSLRGARPRPAAVPDEPGVFSGFTAMRVAALLVFAMLAGLGAGVLAAPKEKPKPTTPRTRAEQQFSQGNKFYAEGRFDDALGSYRGSIAMDRTFAPAYRAKAAALAKQRRGDEAASAYRTYLEMSPGVVDAEQVREVLQRYDGEAKP